MDDVRKGLLGAVAVVADVEGPVVHGCASCRGIGGGGSPFSGGPCGRADIVDMHGVDAEAGAPEPFHLLLQLLVHPREA